MQFGFFQTIMALLSISAPPPAMRNQDTQIQSALRYLESNVDPFTDPCHNMQKYACGNFGVNSLYDIFVGHKTHTSSQGERYTQVDKILLDMLNESKPAVAAVQKAKMFFSKCMNQEDGEKSITQELNRVGFPGSFSLSPYYLVYGDIHHALNYMKIWANSLKIPTLFSNFFMFRVEVIRDLYLRENKPPYSYVPEIFTEPPNSKIVQQSTEHWALDRILEYFNPSDDAPPVKIEKSLLLSRINSATDGFWSLVRQIAKPTQSTPTKNGKNYTRTNLAELQANTDKWMAEMESSRRYNKDFKIDWKKFFGYLFEDVSSGDRARQDKIEKMLNDDSNFVIYVSDMKKFKNYVQLLAKTESKTFALSIWLSTVINTIPMGPLDLHWRYYREARTVPRVLTLRKEEMCLAIIKDTFRSVVAHELLRNVTEDDKIAVREMVDHTKAAFHKIIEKVTWLSQTAKVFMYPKIKSLQVHIPYADTTKNPDMLEDSYKEVDLEFMSFYRSYVHILGIKRRTEFNRIFYPNPNKSRLEIRPPVNLFPNEDVVKYYPRENEIEISIAAFGYPYYYGSHYLLQPLNLGALGFHVVRKMVHAFDELMIKIIEDKSEPTLQSDDKPTMKDRIQKAITKTIQRSTTGNGESTKSSHYKNAQLEAIADNISLTVCYRTLLDYHSKSLECLTPQNGGLIERCTRKCKDVTPSEYFTSALTMTMCEKPPPTSVTTYMQYGERINELFKHWPHFKAIRKCSDNARMMKLDEDEIRISILEGNAHDENHAKTAGPKTAAPPRPSSEAYSYTEPSTVPPEISFMDILL